MAILKEQDITQALKLTTTQETKKLVLEGVKGSDDFPDLLKNYKWATAKPYDIALIIIACYTYCIKSQDSSLKKFGKTAKSQSNDSFKLLNYLLKGDDAKVKSLIKKCFPDPMNTILEIVISSESERKLIIDNFFKQTEKFKSSDFDERKKVCIENMIYILTDQELKQIAKDFAKNKEAAKKAANIVPLKKQLTKALESTNLKTVQQIIENNPNFVNAKLPPYGQTPLHYAVDNRRWEIIDLLLQHNANPNIQNNDNKTPLHIATEYADQKMVELLLQHGADPNIQNNNNDTPLHFAARQTRYLKIMNLLLQHHANPNIQNKEGRTPLLIATEYEEQEMVDLLLQHGANTEIQEGRHGFTPLDFAVINGYREIVDLLLQHGADPNIHDNYNDTPLH
ncbi:MAG: ankyrin repeat domain-containing protein, partial [Clostridia bacterium]|nr:ankyrin repeat domain-containing protein [Clostridia bacterium]